MQSANCEFATDDGVGEDLSEKPHAGLLARRKMVLEFVERGGQEHRVARPFRRDIALHTAGELVFELEPRCVESGHGIGVFLPGGGLLGANGQLPPDVGQPPLHGSLWNCVGRHGGGNDTDRTGRVGTAVADGDTCDDPQDDKHDRRRETEIHQRPSRVFDWQTVHHRTVAANSDALLRSVRNGYRSRCIQVKHIWSASI
jgi:hypothetical protein